MFGGVWHSFDDRIERRCIVNSIYEIFSLASFFFMLFIEFTILVYFSREMYIVFLATVF